jgi:type IV secretory pathway TraG/TraD family ATPase VirD4
MQFFRMSVLGTLTTALDAWQEPSVANATNQADITPQWLTTGPNTLYVVAPASEQRRLQGLVAAALTYLIDGALKIAQASPGERLDPPLLACLDELCNCAPLPELPTYASSGAGQGLLLLSVVQDVAQLIAAFGEGKANTILSNHRARLFWSGTGDPKTLQYWTGSWANNRSARSPEQVAGSARKQRPSSGGRCSRHRLQQKVTA